MKSRFNGLLQPFSIRKVESESRKGMRMSLIEGIPASIIANFLGGPLQTVFLTYLGFSAFHIGLALAIPSFALLVQIIIAFAMQKWQNRRLLVVITGIAHRALWVTTGLIPLTFSEDAWVPVYMVVWTLCMIAGQAAGVIWTSLMADVVPPALRGKYFGIRNTIHWFVVCATLLVGGQIMEWLPGAKGFTVLFVVSAACVIWNGLALSQYPNPQFQPSESGSSIRLLFKPFADKRFRTATLFVAFFILLQNIVVPLFAYIMIEFHNLSTSTVTQIIMLQNGAMMISYYFWGILNSRYSTNRLLMWTFPIIALSCLMWFGMIVLPVLLILILVHIVLGCGLAGYNLLVFNFLIGDSPKSERPMYIAVFSAFTGLAGFIAPTAGGWLYDTVKGGPAWLLGYGIVTIAGISMLAMALIVAPIVFKAKAGDSIAG
ncbi:MAG: MFS transporter [Candidatus Cohnella colombiensis]|uniref:MFS transporter n=1 Tax=Candidatus Cohnella colombiensis TaxID=3121368 RepID=A0AA95EZZ8_9BACL|nr:MAG: MFS transporter [Cohnella sp.]